MTKIEKFAPLIEKLVRQGISVVKIVSEISKQGYAGKYHSVWRYVKNHKLDRELKKYKPSIRFETEPGEQAQVDWGSFGKIEVNGRKERLYAFVYVLGYSRAVYVEFAIHQDLKTLQECHKNAFATLGIPEIIVYDNMKTVVIRRDKRTGEPHYNPAFKDFADFYDFKIELCPPYWPRAKGKVEAAVKYLRNNFWQGMKYKKNFKTLEELNQSVKIWLETIANSRQHRTTHQLPNVRWEEEKPYLKFPDSERIYQVSPFQIRYSTKDGLLEYQHNYYSVPIDFARKKLFVEEKPKSGIPYLSIYFEDKIIAEHPLSAEKGKVFTKEEHLFPKSSKKKTFVKNKIFSKSKNEHRVPTRDWSYYDELIAKAKNG